MDWQHRVYEFAIAPLLFSITASAIYYFYLSDPDAVTEITMTPSPH